MYTMWKLSSWNSAKKCFWKGGSFSKGRWFFRVPGLLHGFGWENLGSSRCDSLTSTFSTHCTEVAYGAYIPTLTAPFIGNAPGVWEDLRPPNRSCWRLINDDYTSGWMGDDGGWWGMMGDDGGGKMEREEQQKQIPKRKRKRLWRQNGKGSQGMRTFLVHLFVHFV